VLSAVAFLDRVNISIAGSSLAMAYHLSNVQLGWVFSAFLAGYPLFQTPGGRLVDRLGSRRVLAAQDSRTEGSEFALYLSLKIKNFRCFADVAPVLLFTPSTPSTSVVDQRAQFRVVLQARARICFGRYTLQRPADEHPIFFRLRGNW